MCYPIIILFFYYNQSNKEKNNKTPHRVFTDIEAFSIITVEKPETRRLSASISWDAFRKGRSLARNHISICFFSPLLTFQLTKVEEIHKKILDPAIYNWCNTNLLDSSKIKAWEWAAHGSVGNWDRVKICTNGKCSIHFPAVRPRAFPASPNSCQTSKSAYFSTIWHS